MSNGERAVRITLTSLLAAACAQPSQPADSSSPPASGPTEVEELIAAVSPERLRADTDRLAGFGTRHSLSDTESETRGIGAARRWLHAQFEAANAASGRTGDDALRVSFDRHDLGVSKRVPESAEIVNVMCEIPGAMPEAAARRYYAIAHYDSRATDVMQPDVEAPGANDDGSGTVGLLELARVLSMQRFDATIVLMAVAGEEQGLLGSRAHARAAKDAGHEILGVLSADMIGDPTGASDGAGGVLGTSARDAVRVFSEGLPRSASPEQLANLAKLGAENDSRSRQLARYVAEIAALHATAVQPLLVFRNDRFLRGGDHTSFVEQGFAAVRFTELHENFDRQHQDLRTEDGRVYGDTAEFVDEGYLADVTRVNAAALAHLARAPSPPPETRIIVASLANDTTLRWSPSPESDVASYEVVWRATTSPTWTDSRDVGDVTEATIELSKDHWLFGVRAVDREGYKSPVAFPDIARE